MKPAIWVRQRRVSAVLAVGTAGALLTLSAATASAATGSGHPAKVAVPQGVTASPLGKPVFPTPGKTRERVSFVLRLRDQQALGAKVEAGMPGGYLTVRQFRARYGQSTAHVRALRRYLARYGIKTMAYADGLDVSATGTARQFDKALTVRQEEYQIPASKARAGVAARPATQIHGTTDAPLLPASLASFTESILGLTNWPLMASQSVRIPTAKDGKPFGEQLGERKPSNFASQYDLNPLYAKGSKGQGQTIGIVTYASMRPSDAEYFWSKVLKIRTKKNRITIDKIDGGSGKVLLRLGSDESTLDVEQSGALAPQANIVVYEAPNTDAGYADGFFAPASQDKATVVSNSWGSSETYLAVLAAAGEESATYVQVADEAFLEMAAQGQSTFVAAGDSGAYAASSDIGSKNLSVNQPSDSPWTVSAGGTTDAGTIPLTATDSATIPAQRAWGEDWLWPHWADFEGILPYTTEQQFIKSPYGIEGGGGGYSADEPMPAYQQRISGIDSFNDVQYLTGTDPQPYDGTTIVEPRHWSVNLTPSVQPGTGSGRVQPDLVADADPFTGYLLYFSGFGKGSAALEAGWGGTSFVAPQLAGSAAVINSYVHHRVGFWNPAIYKFAAGANSPFTPLNSAGTGNDNLYYTGGGPGTIFSPATGLGTPDLAKLAADFGKLG